jgi:ketosteroid isomerase-like protein
MNGYIKYSVLFLLVSVMVSSCDTKNAEEVTVDYKAAMMEADRDFSKLCEAKGMKFAYMNFIDSKGVLLRPNTAPIQGGEAINYISQGNDTSFIITWEPNGGSIAQSGDLGYTQGVYSLKPKNKDTVFYGTYVRIWKRQPDNKWKFVLESGNEGIQ